MNFEWLFAAVMALVVGNLLFQVVKNKGLRGAIFGAPIVRTLGEIDLGRRSLARTTLKVHILKPREATGPTIGVEMVGKTFASYQMIPIALTGEQARQLSTLISQALAEASG